MQGLITRLMLLAALCMPAAVLAQAAPTHAPPEGFTAPADPRPEDTNAERARSQPGNTPASRPATPACRRPRPAC
jgi:formate dehydrogenase subunit gamma